MAPILSENEKNLEKITKEVKKKNEALGNLRSRMLEDQKALEDFKRKKLEVMKMVEEEKKLEKDKKDLITAVEKEGNIIDFIAFQSDTERKVQDLLKDEDWNKVEKIIDDQDKEILKLQNELDKLETEQAIVTEELKKASEVIKDKQKDLSGAFDEIKELPLKIRRLKQKLQTYRKIIEIEGNKERSLKTVFYLKEMKTAIQEIEKLRKSKSQTVKRLDGGALKEAQKKYCDTKEEYDKSQGKVKSQQDILRKIKSAREGNILREIEAMFVE